VNGRPSLSATVSRIAIWLPLIVFLLVPLATVLLTSLTGEPINLPAALIGHAGPLVHQLQSAGLGTYRQLALSSYHRAALVNSVVLATSVGLTGTLIGTLTAFAVERWHLPGSRLFGRIMMFLLIAPPFIGAYAFTLLGGQHGLLTRLAAAVGLHVQPDFHTAVGIFIVETYHAIALPYLIVSPMLCRTDPQLLDAARTLGATGLFRLFRIDVPLVAPGIASGALVAAIGSFADLGTPLVLAARNVPLLPVEAYQELVGYVDWGLAAALSCVMIACALAILVLYVRWTDRQHVETVVGSVRLAESGDATGHAGLRRGSADWLGAAALLLVISVPIAAYGELAVMAIAGRWGATVLPEAWTLAHLKLAFWDFPQPYLRTAVLCGTAMMLCLLYGSWIVGSARRSRALDVVTTLPLIVPGTAIAIALISAYNAPPLALHQTAFIVVIALSVRRLPYAVRALSAARAQLDPLLGQAAATLGAPPLFTAVKVFMPLLAPAIRSAGLLVFVTGVTEVSSTILLAPADWTPAAVHVYNLVHELALYDAAAYAIGLMAMVAILERLMHRQAFAIG